MLKSTYIDQAFIMCGMVFQRIDLRVTLFFLLQNLDTMLIKTPDLIEAMIELACSRRWLQTTIYVIEFSQHVIQGLWLKDSSLLQVGLSFMLVRAPCGVRVVPTASRLVIFLRFCLGVCLLRLYCFFILSLVSCFFRFDINDVPSYV